MNHVSLPAIKKMTLERVAHSITTWQHDIVALLPTQKLTPEMFETQRDDAYEATRAYETAFALRAAELCYWEHQTGP